MTTEVTEHHEAVGDESQRRQTHKRIEATTDTDSLTVDVSGSSTTNGTVTVRLQARGLA